MYRSYHYLRPLAVFAGIFGAIQGLAWIGMAMTGIIAYYCHFNFENHLVKLGTMLDFTFYELYFHGNCINVGFPNVDEINFEPLAAVNTMRSVDVHAWMWIYLVISFCWFISSLTLLTNVSMDYIKYANIFLYIWIFITFAISVLDLATGILFALDYNTLMNVAHDMEIVAPNPVTINHLIIGYAQVAAGIMMSIAFRGWIVWLINIALSLYFFRETFKIYDYNKMQGLSEGHPNSAFVAEPHSMLKSHPIDAYAFNHNQNNFNNRWNVTNPNSNQDTERRERARSFSGPSVHDERVRPVHVEIPPQPQIRRYQPPAQQHREDDVVLRRDAAASTVARELRNRQSYNDNNNNHNFNHTGGRAVYVNDVNVPAPDYSPPPMRAYDNRPPLRSALRNSRYQ